MYVAMDAEELAEALAFHETQAAYQQTWQHVDAAPTDARALPSPVSVPVTHRIPWTEELPAVGQSAATTRSFHKEDVVLFARLSGDRNPLHLDPEAWVGTPFSGNLVHGALTASLFSQLMGMELPGPGAVYLNQTLTFQAPVYIGETVTARVTVTHVRTDKRIITLQTHAEVTRDGLPVTVLEGEAVTKLLKAPQRDRDA
jgi:acyl dehydratase